MGSVPVTVVANSMHRHDQWPIHRFGNLLLLRPDWNEVVFPTGYTCPQVQDVERAGCGTGTALFQSGRKAVSES